MGANRGSSVLGEVFLNGIYFTLFLIVFCNCGGADLSLTAQLSPLIASCIFFVVMLIIGVIKVAIRGKSDD